MGISVFAISSSTALWNYVDIPTNSKGYYIGWIGEYFNAETSKIKDKRIKQFKYITINSNTIFNREQVKHLKEEIEILEKLEANKEMLEIIKKGIAKVLENEKLYLKFKDD